MTRLITHNDLLTGTTMESNVSPNLTLSHIDNAQFIYIKKFLGTEQYNSLITTVDLVGINNLSGLNLTLYTYLKPMLVNYTMYMAMPFLGNRISEKGININTSDNTKEADKDRQLKMRTEYFNVAQEYQQQALVYLRNNYTSFPLWKEDIYYAETNQNATNASFFGGIQFGNDIKIQPHNSANPEVVFYNNYVALFNTKLNRSGDTWTNTLRGDNLSAQTIHGTTLYSGNTDVSSLFPSINAFNNQNIINTNLFNTKVNRSGDTMTGQLTTTALSATTLSGGTILSANTNLYSIFAPIESITRLQNGINTFTGGTAVRPTVNITAATLSTLNVSGITQLNVISGNTLNITGLTTTGALSSPGTIAGTIVTASSLVQQGGANVIINGVNLGGGEEVFASKGISVLNFKTLVGSGGISLSSNASELTINSTPVYNLWANGTNSLYALQPKGSYNTVNDTSNYSFLAGSSNQIKTESHYSSILNGLGNIIQSASTFSTINSGYANLVDRSGVSSILGGGYNKMYGTSSSNSKFNTILNGKGNYLTTSTYTSVQSANNSRVNNASFSVLAGGMSHTMANVNASTILGGYHCGMKGANNNCHILGGYNSNLDYSTNSVMVGSYTSFMANSYKCAILGSNYVTMNNCYKTTVIGNSTSPYIILSAQSFSNFIYGQTYLKEIATAPAPYLLVSDADGKITKSTTFSSITQTTYAVTSSTIANSTVESAFTASYTINANTLSVGKAIKIKLYGTYGTNLIAPNLTGKIKIGGTTVLNTGALTCVTNLTNAGWSAEALIIVNSIGATGSFEVQGYAEFATAATTALSVNVANTSPFTINTTTNQAITVTAQWSSANASNTITLRQFLVEII